MARRVPHTVRAATYRADIGARKGGPPTFHGAKKPKANRFQVADALRNSLVLWGYEVSRYRSHSTANQRRHSLLKSSHELAPDEQERPIVLKVRQKTKDELSQTARCWRNANDARLEVDRAMRKPEVGSFIATLRANRTQNVAAHFAKQIQAQRDNQTPCKGRCISRF